MAMGVVWLDFWKQRVSKMETVLKSAYYRQSDKFQPLAEMALRLFTNARMAGPEGQYTFNEIINLFWLTFEQAQLISFSFF